MQKYLHISKKSSIFAAGLGIVPAITIKYQKSMEKEKVFVCRFCGKTYTIYVMHNTKVVGFDKYVVYVGRKRLEPYTWGTFEGAVGTILDEHPEFESDRYVRIWS